MFVKQECACLRVVANQLDRGTLPQVERVKRQESLLMGHLRITIISALSLGQLIPQSPVSTTS